MSAKMFFIVLMLTSLLTLKPVTGESTAMDSINVATTASPWTSENSSSPALDSALSFPYANDTSSPGLDNTPGSTIADDNTSPALDLKAGPTITYDTSSHQPDFTPDPTTFDKISSPGLEFKPVPIFLDKTSSTALDSTPGPTIAGDTSSPGLDSASDFTRATAHTAGLSTSDLRRCFEQRVDLVFVVDASYSVKAYNFERAKFFINQIVSGLPISQTTVRVALVRYDKDVSIINPFLDNLEAVTDSVSNMTYPDVAGTNTGGALREVREKIFDVRKEDGVKDIVITITDGQSDQVDVTEEEAGLLRDQGVQLVWLYIYKGGGPLEDEKNFMEEQGDSVIVVDNFDKLTDDIVSKMLVASCPERTTPSTTTFTLLTTDLQITNPSTAVASTDDDNMTTASVDSLVSTAEQSVTLTDQPSITTESSVVSSSSFASAIAESSTADIWFPEPEMTSEANIIMSSREEIFTAAHDDAGLPVLRLSTILLGQHTTAVADASHTITEQTNESSTEEKDDDSALNHTTWTPPSSPAAVRMTTYSTESTTTSQTAQQQSTTTEAKTSPPATSATTHAGSTFGDFTSATEMSSQDLREGSLVSDGDKPWHKDWPLIVGVTAGVVGIAALSTGFLIFVLRRRRQGTHDITPASATS